MDPPIIFVFLLYFANDYLYIMIKLDTSYSLGSIIESNFLGISNDAESDNVIVTLSKNMVTCFHVSVCYVLCI